MRKIFIIRLVALVTIFMLILLIIGNILINTYTIDGFYTTAELKINQINQILEQNAEEIETLSKATYDDVLSRVEAIAYIIENTPEIADDDAELTNLANIMQIDEIHIFDADGVIIAGTVPSYIGIGVDDGEQIGFFKQILEDPSKKLVQEITPATADDKMMQYTGIARRDEPGIVQIGMRPERMLETMSRNDLDYVLSKMVTNEGETMYVIDKESGLVLGSTADNYIGINFYDMGLQKAMLQALESDEFYREESAKGCAVLASTDELIICIFQNRSNLVDAVNVYISYLLAGLILVASLLIFAINKLLGKYVISGITSIIGDLKIITAGNLSNVATITNNPELKELGSQINTMVGYLIHSTAKISKIIESVDIDIGIFEYKKDMRAVYTTDRLAAILGLDKEDTARLYADKVLFQEKIQEIYAQGFEFEDDTVYLIQSREGDRYIKINSFEDEVTTFGIIIDITKDFLRHKMIVHERDFDVLSELYNRRAFTREFEQIFSNTQNLKTACVLMLDMDNLKYTNDNYGHSAGDDYIKALANLLNGLIEEEHCIVARLSGDEFVVFWYGFENENEILQKIQKLKEHSDNAYIMVDNGLRHPVKFSAGYILYPEYKLDQHALLHLADTAMYEAKQKGKGQFIRYNKEGLDTINI